MKYDLIINEELMQGQPHTIERMLLPILANQILTMNGNNYENVVENMRQYADIFEILEEHINDDFITLRYNPMGAWYISEEDEDGGNYEE